jgi:hypothetical protein
MTPELLRFVEFDERIKPLDYTRMWYALFSEVLFEDDLSEYLRNGCIVSRPTCFMFYRPCNIAAEGEPDEIAWYIRFAYGNLLELLNAFPAHLPKLVFYRAGFGRTKVNNKMRVCSYDKMMRLAERIEKGKETNGQ